MVQLLTVTCRSLVLSNKGKGMQSSSEQPLVGEERYVTTRITAAKETKAKAAYLKLFAQRCFLTFKQVVA